MPNWKDEIWFNEQRSRVIKELLRGGVYEVSDSKVRLAHEAAMAYDITWVIVGQPNNMCEFWNRVYWIQFGLRPAVCRTQCYKVVAKILNAGELLDVHSLMQQIHTIHGYTGKCGLDIRWYSPGLYVAFWYNDTLEEGLKCYETVKEAIAKQIDPTFAHDEDRLFLKKGCTEMEHPLFGGIPSDQWGEPTEDDIAHEARLDNIFGKTSRVSAQPEWLVNKVLWEWLKAASTIGDKTYMRHGIEDITQHKAVKYNQTGGDVGKLTVVGDSEERETQVKEV